MGMICFADADKRRRKNKWKKTFTFTAAPVTVTYNDKCGREKRESSGRY
jgi:hypothetical protein